MSYGQLAPLANKTFSEHYSSDVEVSGNVLVGILIESSQANSRFFVKSSSDTNLFCLRVSSIDGTYFSENEYLLEEVEHKVNAQGLVEVEYPTQFKSILTGFADEELSLLASEGSCGDRAKAYLMATKDLVEDDDKLLFLISSGRSQVFMRLKSDASNFMPRCKRIETGKRTTYDTICETDLSLFKQNTYSAEIIRRKNGRKLEDIEFDLHLEASK